MNQFSQKRRGEYEVAKVALGGKEANTNGNLPTTGTKAIDFSLVDKGLKTVSLANYAGKRKVLNIFPSIDTPTCATSVRTFNKHAASMKNTVVLNISKDLPFAQSRFCAVEGIENALALSCFRSTFAKDYGIELVDSALMGLTARAVVVVDENDKVIHAELVGEIADEPSYEAVLGVLN
jgi:thioredoxin-dependent peroxiredoxin